ncbi:AbrB family transcriptional regulator, partial [Escherichia coli]
MPVLQWGMLCVLSLLLSIGFLALHLPAALLLGPMIAGIIFSMHGVTLQLPRSAFLAAQAILGCMIAQNLTGSILTTLAVNWPIVLAILLVPRSQPGALIENEEQALAQTLEMV